MYPTGHQVLGKLAERAGIPKTCSRMVIDIPDDGAVRIYYQCFGDDDTLGAALDAVLGVKGVDIVRVGEHKD